MHLEGKKSLFMIFRKEIGGTKKGENTLDVGGKR